jgi:MFS family permease
MALVNNRGLSVWLVGVLYYLYQYIIRVSPGVMVDELMLTFALDAESLGYLVAVTTFFYALAQIPVGVFSDLFGARKMILYSLTICVIGVAAVAWTQHLWVAFTGRVLIGIGSAAGFICVSKVASDWFPPSQKAFWLSLTVVMGTLGALLGYTPLAKLTAAVGWRESLMYLTGLGALLYLLNFFFLKEQEGSRASSSDRRQLVQEIKDVLKSRFAWMYALTALGLYAPISVFADLWGISFLTLKYDLAKDSAASLLSLAYVGTCGGSLGVALMSHVLKNTRLLIGLSSAIVGVLMAIVVYVPALSQLELAVILFMLGVVSGGEILCFSKVCQENDVQVAATVTGFLNFVVTIGAAFIQQLVGRLIKWFWTGETASSGLPIYQLKDYQYALTLIVLFVFSSVVLAFFLKDKNPAFSSN